MSVTKALWYLKDFFIGVPNILSKCLLLVENLEYATRGIDRKALTCPGYPVEDHTLSNPRTEFAK